MRGSAEQSVVRTCACALFASLLGISGAVRGQEPIQYQVRAHMNAAEGDVDANVEVEVALPEGQTELRLWVYADRVAVEPRAIGEMSARWIYPGEVHLGSATVDNVSVDGVPANISTSPLSDRDAGGSEIIVSIDSGAARHVTLRYHSRVHVPARFGRLGHDGDILSLEAPWYPLVLGHDGAWDFRVTHHVRAEGTGGEQVMLAGHLGQADDECAYVPAIAAPELHAYARTVDGVSIRIVSAEELYVPPSSSTPGEGGLVDLVRVNEIEHIEDAFSQVIQTMHRAGLVVPHREFTVVFVPSRVELASTADSTILVSDRIFEVIPAEGMLTFHERALMRAIFRSMVRELSSSLDAPLDRPWVDDMRAALLIDVDDARRHGHVRTPEELIGFAAFHPAVDQILYAPQIQFADAFFGTVDEADVFRDDPMRAHTPIARGRRLLEFARDLLGADGFGDFAESLLHAETSVRESLLEANPVTVDRLPMWLASPVTQVNYRLVSAQSTPDPAGGFVHNVVVARDGAVRVEPVEVRVQDENGNLVVGTWDGAGAQGTIVLHSDSPLRDALIDPRSRLPESGQLTDGHPRTDNATLHPWRPPLLSSFNLSYAGGESRLDGVINVVMHRRYDLEHSFALELSSDAVGSGGMVRYLWGVGRKRDNNNRIGAISVAADISRLRAGYTAGSAGGWQSSVYLLGNLDTRVYATDPREGTSLRAAIRFGGVQRDGGALTFSASANVRGSYSIPIGLLNVLHLFAGVSVTVGDALPGQYQGLGGRYLLRGLESGELVGRGRAYAVAEHRWTVLRDLDWNFLHLAWVREIQLAAFAGAGVIFDQINTGVTKFGADAGGGLRIHFQYGGVQPGVMSIDIAAPLTRESRDVVYNGVVLRERPATSFYVTFDQYF